MFEPDEYIFTKFAFYFKKRKKRKEAALKNLVLLTDIKPKLSIIARAATGESIEIYEAEREGGFKNNSFFLPSAFNKMASVSDNIMFYVYRTLYLSIQKSLNQNWPDQTEPDIEVARQKAFEGSGMVISELFNQYPFLKEFHHKLIVECTNNSQGKTHPDMSFVYGKWMRSLAQPKSKFDVDTFEEFVKPDQDETENTLLNAKAVEEIISVQIDLKQQEDAVLQHQFEKAETVEEFGGNFRDFDGEDDLDDHSNALEEINMKYAVRVNDTVHSTYQTDFIENTTVKESAKTHDNSYHIKYPEWDYKIKQYKKDFCAVYPEVNLKEHPEYYSTTIEKYQSVLLGLRKMLASVNNKYQQQRRQQDGNEFDLDAVTDLYVDAKSGHTPSERIYLSNRKKEKDLSIMLLLDLSLSSDGYSAGNKIIDVEKQVSILFGEILDEFHIDFAISGFHSNTRNHTSFTEIKGFETKWQKAKHRIGSIEAKGYTRIGAALRHANSIIDKRSSKNKWVILISDGKPNDYDKYEGQYGVKDVKQALKEMNQNQIHSYAIAIEAQAKYYLPQMFGQNHYQILSSPIELLQSLVKLYEKIKHQS